MIRTTIGVVLLSAVLAGAGAPAQAAPLTWAPAATIDHRAPFGTVENLREIECASTSLCIASSTDGSVATTADPTAASPTWSVPQPLGIDGAPVACPSDVLCVAAEPTDGKVFVSTNPRAAEPAWTQTADITASPAVITRLLSCPTTTLCVAIDSAQYASVSTNPGAALPTWTRSSAPIDADQVTDLECPSTALCVAVDAHGHTVTSTNPTAVVPTWGAPVDVNGGALLDEVSCPTTTMCAASTGGGGLLVSTDPAAASPTWSPSNPGTGISNIDCPTEYACVASGFGGSIWATADAKSVAPTWTTVGVNAAISDLSCGSLTLCFGTVGNAGTATRSADAFAASPTWGAKTAVVGANALAGAACPADGLCVAVSDAGHILTTTNPTSPSPVWTRSDVVGTFRDVSCPSASLCVAVDKEGYAAVSQDPAAAAPTWTRLFIAHESTAPFTRQLVAVSCPSTELCVAADKDGGLFVSTTPTATWQPRIASPLLVPTAVSCRAGGQCALADGGSSRVYATADVRAAAPVWTFTDLAPYVPFLTDIACPSTERCVASGATGETSTSADPFSPAPTWSPTAANGVVYVACPILSFCLGAAAASLRASADGGATWATPIAPPGPALQLSDVDCASASVCVAVDARGRAALGVAPPQSTGPPAIGGSAAEGDTLSATPGTWSAAPAIARQWLRCDAAGGGCAAVAGETGPSYAVGAADVGHTLRVRETASNRAGSAGPVDSAASAVVTAVPVAPPPPPAASPPGTAPPTVVPVTTPKLPSTAAIRAALAAARRVTGKPARIAALLKRGSWTFAFRAPGAGKLEVTWLSIPARRGARPVILARVKTTMAAGQTKKVTVRLTAAGRKALRKARRLKITVRPTFTPVGGKPVTAAGRVTLKR